MDEIHESFLEPKAQPATCSPVYLTLHGVPSTEPPPAGDPAYFRDASGGLRTIHGDLLYEINNECVRLDESLVVALFGNMSLYSQLLPRIPRFVFEAGLNSESKLSKSDFERLLVVCRDMPHLNRLLYLYDVSKLISGITECTKEVCFFVSEFYRSLNCDELLFSPVSKRDGVYWASSSRLIATLNFIYIRLHSLLDYTTKLVYEIDHLHDDFTIYPKLASSKIKFGDRCQIKWDEIRGTLFEPSESIIEIELVRNFIVHDGLLDDTPKVYNVVRDGQIVEKFILMPDRVDRRFDRYSNRTLFYSCDDKINLRLPKLISDFHARQLATLQCANARLADIRT